MKILLLPDELKVFTQKAVSLWEEYKEAWKRAGDACTQSSETWHDNFEFEDANRAMQLASKKLGEVQKILNSAQVISQLIDNKVINIGKKVKLCINGKDNQEYTIGWYHSPVEWRIGYSAPIIQPLLWKTEGDIVEFLLHGKKQEVEVMEVEIGVNLNI